MIPLNEPVGPVDPGPPPLLPADKNGNTPEELGVNAWPILLSTYKTLFKTRLFRELSDIIIYNYIINFSHSLFTFFKLGN